MEGAIDRRFVSQCRALSAAFAAALALALLMAGCISLSPPCAAQGSGSYRTLSKTCGKCGRQVSISAKVGDTCPYCGAVWGAETSTYVPSSSGSSPHRTVPAGRSRQLAADDSAANRYRWNPGGPRRAPSHDLILKDVRDDGSVIKTYRLRPGGDGTVAMQFTLVPDGSQQGTKWYFDTLGAYDIEIEIDGDVGETRFAGLHFRDGCTVGILADGTVVVDQAGITVEDEDGKLWSSRALRFNGQRRNVFVPAVRQRATAPGPVSTDDANSYSGDGRNQVSVANPKGYTVEVSFRAGGFEQTFTLDRHTSRTFYLPDGDYETFFVFSDEPGARYRGNRLHLNGTIATITLAVQGGNMPLRRVN
jgi:hypothetical protein